VRGAILDGRVADPEGRPVPGAEVSGYWLRPARGYETVSAVSDRAGTFRIEGVDPKAEVLLSARRGAAVTATPVPGRAEEGPVMLTVSPDHAVAVSGRVVDPDGRPLADAIVRLESRKRGPEDFEVEAGRVVFDADGGDTVLSDPDGRFRTPRLLRPDLEYRARVEAEGRILSWTEWIAAARSTAFPEVVLHPIEPTRTVEGRVVDRDGRPIAGAEVSQSGDGPRRTRTVADAEGRFRLPGLFREPAFLYVAGEGLRLAGHRIAAAGGPVELSVRREGDPPGPTPRTLPPPLPRAEEKALALRLIEPDLERLTGKELTRDMFALLDIVPRIDPARALELAERNALPDPEYNDYLRLNAALGLLEESPEEALAVAETIAKPSLHSRLVRLVSDAVPASDRARKRELLGRALLIARAAPDPADRLEELGLIGYRLLDMGEADQGAAVLREGQRLAETLPRFDPGDRKAPAAHARGRFAAKLARIDARAAFALAEGFNDSYADWYIGGVALGLADRDPAGAERALGMMTWKNLRAIRTGRVAGRMVVKDPGRARRLVLALEDPLERTSGLAMMARGLAGSDPRGAAGLVNETLELLLQLAREGRDRPEDYHGSCITALALLPVAERLDPELLMLTFWEAVALRPPRPAGGDPDGRYEEATAKLALGLARYDRAVARQVLEPVAKRARSVNATGRASRGHTLFAAAALIDPAWAVALIDALPDDPPGADVRPKALARQAVADVLAHGGAGRWEHVEQMYLWLRRDSKDDER
jgi:hypothetical protein